MAACLCRDQTTVNAFEPLSQAKGQAGLGANTKDKRGQRTKKGPDRPKDKQDWEHKGSTESGRGRSGGRQGKGGEGKD